MIAIRDFTPADAPALRTQQYPMLPKDEILQLIDQWSLKQYEGRPFYMLAVTQDETLVGYVSLWRKETDAMSYGVEIFTPYRQQGCAYAASLLAFEKAKREGCKSVTSQVRKTNAASLALHRKLGFSITGEGINRRGHEVFFLEKTW